MQISEVKDPIIKISRRRLHITFPYSRLRKRTVFTMKEYDSKDKIKLKALFHHLKLLIQAIPKEEPLQKKQDDTPLLKKIFG